MAQITCADEGCDKPVCARGLCRPHYRRAYTQGTLPPVATTYRCQDCKNEFTRSGRGCIPKRCPVCARLAALASARNRYADANGRPSVGSSRPRSSSRFIACSQCGVGVLATDLSSEGTCAGPRCIAAAAALVVAYPPTRSPDEQRAWNRQWARDNIEYINDVARERRARLAQLETEFVDSRVVFERDKWRCHLCGERIDPALRWPDPGSASIDHVIPIGAPGSSHTYRNIRASHLFCNQSKGARLQL